MFPPATAAAALSLFAPVVAASVACFSGLVPPDLGGTDGVVFVAGLCCGVIRLGGVSNSRGVLLAAGVLSPCGGAGVATAVAVTAGFPVEEPLDALASVLGAGISLVGSSVMLGSLTPGDADREPDRLIDSDARDDARLNVRFADNPSSLLLVEGLSVLAVELAEVPWAAPAGLGGTPGLPGPPGGGGAATLALRADGGPVGPDAPLDPTVAERPVRIACEGGLPGNPGGGGAGTA